MGRKVGTATMSNRPFPSQNHRSISAGVAGSVKKPTQGPSANAKSMLKHEHLRNLALWAGGEASIPSLAAFFGGKLAADLQALAVTPDPSLFPCQRCETILQPGLNCTVHIEKNRSKSRRKKKGTFTLTQNSVVYKCHFCLHQNLKRGTPKGYNKELRPAKPKAPLVPKSAKTVKNFNLQVDTAKDKLIESNTNDRKPEVSNISPDDPATPSVSGKRTLLDSKRRKRDKSGSKTPIDCGSENDSGMVTTARTAGVSGRKRRNTWTSLKEIVESNEKGDGRTNANTIVPFVL